MLIALFLKLFYLFYFLFAVPALGDDLRTDDSCLRLDLGLRLAQALPGAFANQQAGEPERDEPETDPSGHDEPAPGHGGHRAGTQLTVRGRPLRKAHHLSEQGQLPQSRSRLWSSLLAYSHVNFADF